MTVEGSKCTRVLIDRTLICHAILYHFQITLFCGPSTRPFIPLTLFLLSYPLEQLEFVRLSNAFAEICFIVPTTRPQRFILPRNFQRRYRRHLFYFKPLFQITLASRSLNQLSRLRIHVVQEFHIRRIQSRKNVFETNIVVIHNQIPHISLPDPPLLRSRPHPKSFISSSRRRHDAFVSFCALLMNQSFFFKSE
jgi:hypothetical protein